ncbi:MAG: FRG domain-containing protein [Pseudomonadota bacterium]
MEKVPEKNPLRWHEWTILSQFYRSIDNTGLSLPDHNGWREQLLASDVSPTGIYDLDGEISETGFSNRYMEWPPQGLYPLMALAQHYGLPTRLLDWTFNGLVAAFFAARPALNSLVEGAFAGEIAVWLTSGKVFDINSNVVIPQGDLLPFPVRLVRPPVQHNSNALSQAGVFTLCFSVTTIPETSELGDRDIISCIKNYIEIKSGRKSIFEKPIFYKIKLNATEVPDLLIRLRNMGISSERLFQPPYGSVEHLKDTALLSKL